MSSKTVFLLITVLFISTSSSFEGRNPTKKLLKVLEDRALGAALSKNKFNQVNYRLPDTSIPLHYDLTIATYIHLDESDPKRFDVNGEVEITLQVLKDTDEIVLHSRDHTEVTGVLRDNSTGEVVPWVDDSQPTIEKELEFLRFKTKETLTAGNIYHLLVTFSGKLRERALRGFYHHFYEKENGERSWMAATQFESIYARHAFPCYDEPGLRAEFTVTVVHDKSLHALSNMPIALKWKYKNHVFTKFEKSPAMQSYLLEITVSDLEYIEMTGYKRVPQRVYGRKDALEQGLADMGLLAGVRILDEQQKYFDTKYTLPKLDTIIHTAAGGMEHWGAVTINENAYLHDDKTDSIVDKLPKLELISHEFAHMFFGDLVAPVWWDHLWLNEGFAQYYGRRMIQITHPEVRSMDFYIFQSKQIAMVYDQIESNSRPIIYDPKVPAEIDAVFDLISYDKAAGLVRQLEHLLGEETYKKGMAYYLEDKGYGVADYTDLAHNLQRAINESGIVIGKPIEDFIYNFASQPGFPLVTVYKEPYGLRLEQTRFLEVESHDESQSHPLYMIPIKFATKSNLNFTEQENLYWLTEQKLDIALEHNDEEWIIFNPQSAGFYRVNYDNELWRRIVKVLNANHEQIHLHNRAQLIDDVLYLARGGYTSYSNMLNVWSYLAKEKDFTPWSSANIGLFYLLPKLTDADCNENFLKFLRQIMNPIYNYLGPRDRLEEGIGDKYNRQLIRLLACQVGEKDCVSDAKQRTEDYLFGRNTIDDNLRAITFCNALRYAPPNEFNAVFSRLIISKDLVLRSELIYGLSCNQNENEIELYLNSTINTRTYTYFESERDDLLSYVITSSGTGVRVSIEFIFANFRAIENIYSRPKPVRSQVALMSNYITSDRLLKRYEELLTILRSAQIVTIEEKEAFLEISQKNVEWIRDNDKPLGDALKSYFNGSGKVVVYLTLTLASLCLSVFSKYFY